MQINLYAHIKRIHLYLMRFVNIALPTQTASLTGAPSAGQVFQVILPKQ